MLFDLFSARTFSISLAELFDRINNPTTTTSFDKPQRWVCYQSSPSYASGDHEVVQNGTSRRRKVSGGKTLFDLISAKYFSESQDREITKSILNIG